MSELKKTHHLRRFTCLGLFVATPLAFAAIAAGAWLAHRQHNLQYLGLMILGVAILHLVRNRADVSKKRFKCPQCGAELHRDGEKFNAMDCKFTCAKCDVVWDASWEPPRS